MESAESLQKPITEGEAAKTAGRYQVQEELGHGATGAVYRAYDQLIGRTVALKAISVDCDTPNRELLIERLKLEAKAAGKLDHPNIITIYDVVQENDVIYLSMQFIEGKTLLTFLEEEHVASLSTLIGWADQILSAVGFAHAHGVIHRDLKPANLMLTSQGTIKILDFGIAKVENETLTQAGLVVGTPSHMAPEQVAGKKVDHRADIFALGSVFYELATGEKPFRGDVATILYKIMNEAPVPPSLVNPSIPGGIDAIIRQALAKDPRERFQSCDAMRTAFLNEGARLGIKPASPLPLAAAPAAAAPRAATFPNYLLEEMAPRQSTKKRSTALILTLALIAATSWSFYTRSQTGSFPPLVKTLVGVAYRAWAVVRPVKPDQTAARTSAFDRTVRAQTQPVSDKPSASAVRSQAEVATQASKSQPQNENVPTRSSTTSLPRAPDVATDPDSLRALDQSATPSSDTSTQRNKSNNAAAENVTASNPQAADGETSDTLGTATAQSPATQPLKRPSPEADATVEGFTASDIPQLLSQADVAEERGDYRLALARYQIVLKLDRNNSIARAGQYRINAMAPSH